MSTTSEQPTQVQPTVPPSSDRVPGVRPRDPRSLAPGGPGEPPRPPRRTGGGGGGGGGGNDGGPESGDGPGRVGLYVVIGVVVLVVLGAFAIGMSGTNNDSASDGRLASTSATQTAEPEATPAEATPTAEPEPSPTQAPNAAEDAAKATTPQNQTGGVAIGGGGETGDAADSADAEAEANAPLLQAGSVAKLKFKDGDTIRFRVTSQTAQEVHVHGYDRKYDIAAGETKTIAFPADLTGIFEVEFEDTATQIAELTVEP